MIGSRIAAIECFVSGHWAFALVTTEDGQTGIGESTYFTYPNCLPAIISELSHCYLGEDSFRAEFLYHRVSKKHCLLDAASCSAMAAIDQALWDLKGKALGVPVWQLLGGRVRDRVRAILLIEATDRETLIREALGAKDSGYTAIKIKPFLGDWAIRPTADMLRMVIDNVRSVREALGWKVDIAVELHRNLSPDLAIRFADSVRDLELLFLEDPIQPFSLTVNRHVAERMRHTVALAERNTNIWEFREYSDAPGVTILRPDAGLAGGISQVKKVAAIAESRHQRIVPHNFTSPIITAVHLQLAACTINWDLQGYVREDRAPWNQVVKRINQIEDGFLQIPETPGIGIEADIEFLRKSHFQPFGNKFAHTAHIAMDGGLRQT